MIKAGQALRQGVRRMSSTAAKEYEAALAAEQKHAGSTAATWKNISLFVAFPGMFLAAYQAYTAEVEHMSHNEHVKETFLPYEHLRIRKSRFPWGDGNHSLFHGHMNPLPDGYEH